MGDCRLHVSESDYPFPVHFLQHHGTSYSGSVNLGAASCSGPVLVLSDNDVEWLPGSSIVPAVEEIMRHPDVGVAGPQLVFPGGRWQRSAGPFPSVREAIGSMMLLGVLENRLASARHARGALGPVRDVDYVDGACMAVARKCFDQLQGYDPDCDFYAVDTDFSWRAKLAGWRRVIVPAAQVMHIRGASSSGPAPKAYAKRLFAAKKWFVQKMSGDTRAALYNVLQRAAAVEYAVLYGVVAAVSRTPKSRRRALSALAMAQAAVEGDSRRA
jgi:GT2 family glycosyltransferase